MSDSRAVIEQFKRGGQGFTFPEWKSLSPEDQASAIEVQRELDYERAAHIAYFLLNPKAMFDTLGGDDAMVRAVLEGIVK